MNVDRGILSEDLAAILELAGVFADRGIDAKAGELLVLSRGPRLVVGPRVGRYALVEHDANRGEHTPPWWLDLAERDDDGNQTERTGTFYDNPLHLVNDALEWIDSGR